GEFVFKFGYSRSLRISIWHLHIGGYTACYCGGGLTSYISLVCEAGFTEVNLVINNSGQKQQTFGINNSIGSWEDCIGFVYPINILILYQDTAFEGPTFINNSSVLN